jgi:uroporphyrinogen decarboxylase
MTRTYLPKTDLRVESAANHENLQKALRGEKPDARPWYLFISQPFIRSSAGVDLKTYLNDPKTMFDAQMHVIEALDGGFDLIADYGLLAEETSLGCELKFDDHGTPYAGHAGYETIDDVLAVGEVDPWAGSYMTRALEALQYMKENAPAGQKVEAAVQIAPFSLAATVRGISDFCVDLYVDPDFAHALVDLCVRTEISFLKEQEKILGTIERVFIGDDISSFMKPEDFRTWCVPTYQQLFDAFPGAQRWLHNDAEANHLLADIKACGWQAWHVGDMIDVVEVSKQYGGSPVLFGNLVPTADLVKKSPAEVYNLCCNLLEAMGDRPGLVLSTAGYLSIDTPLENVRALMQAASEFKL